MKKEFPRIRTIPGREVSGYSCKISSGSGGDAKCEDFLEERDFFLALYLENKNFQNHIGSRAARLSISGSVLID